MKNYEKEDNEFKVNKFNEVNYYTKKQIDNLEDMIHKEEIIINNLQITLDDYKKQYENEALENNKTIAEMKEDFIYKDYLKEQLSFHIDIKSDYQHELRAFKTIYNKLWSAK